MHVVTLSNEFMFSVGCDNVQLFNLVPRPQQLRCNSGSVCLSCPQITDCNSLSDKYIQSKYWPNRLPNSAEAEEAMSNWRGCVWKENCKRFCNAAVTWTEYPPNVKQERYRSVWGTLGRQTVTAWLFDCLTDCFACCTSHTQLFVRPLDPRNYDNLFLTHFVLTYDFSLTIFITLQL